jgi:hypothetical protein
MVDVETVMDGLLWKLDAGQYTSGPVRDSIGGMEFTAKAITIIGQLKAWNIEYLDRTGGTQIQMGRRYTHAYWLNWREADAGISCEIGKFNSKMFQKLNFHSRMAYFAPKRPRPSGACVV